MLCLYWMSFPVFLARTVFCGDGLGWGEGSALRTPCQAGEWLHVTFLCLSPVPGVFGVVVALCGLSFSLL